MRFFKRKPRVPRRTPKGSSVAASKRHARKRKAQVKMAKKHHIPTLRKLHIATPKQCQYYYWPLPKAFSNPADNLLP